MMTKVNTYTLGYAGRYMVLREPEYRKLKELYKTRNTHGVSFECFVYGYYYHGMYR